MTRGAALFGLALAGALAHVPLAGAADIKPAIVYDLGGKFDKSFNEGVANGANKFKQDTGIDFRDFEVQNDAQREQALRRFAHDGYSPIIAVGFSQESALTKVAPEFPDTQFAIIDAVVDKPNVRSILFKEHEGSFLVGLLAAKTSKTGKIGFVGGMDIPLIRKFACGYVAGAKYANPGDRGAPEHDRHDGRRLERSGQGRRAREVADGSRRRRRLSRRRRHRSSACCARSPMRASSGSASIRTRTASSRAMC